MTEQIARAQDVRPTSGRIKQAANEFVVAMRHYHVSEGGSSETTELQNADDALDVLDAEFAALLDALEAVLRDIGFMNTDTLRYTHGPSINSTEPAFALLRKHGRLT